MKTFSRHFIPFYCLLIACGQLAGAQPQVAQTTSDKTTTSSTRDRTPLEDSPASQIIMKSLEAVDEGNHIGGLTLSRDEKHLWYGRSDNSGHFMISRELATHKVIRSIPVPDLVETLGVSPDEKRVIYCYGQFGKSLGVLDISTGKTVKLPRYVPNCSKSTLLWDSPASVKVIDDSNTYVLDLETLTEKKLFRDEMNRPTASAEEISQEINAWLDQYRTPPHEHAKLVYSFQSTALLVADKHSDYSRQLHSRPAEKWVATPNLKHFAMISYGFTGFSGQPPYSLLIGHLDTRPPVQLEFPIDFDPSQLDDEITQLKTLVGEGRTITGKIYDPEINPLNGAVTGPMRGKYKGTAQVLNENGNWMVRISYEERLIEEGDVISDFIPSKSRPGTITFTVKRFWTQLKHAGTSEASDKVTAQKARIIREFEGACPEEGACIFDTWIARDEVIVYTERSENSPVYFSIKNGEKVKGITSMLEVNEVGKMRVTTGMMANNERDFSLREGEVIDTYYYLGVGYMMASVDGRDVEISGFDCCEEEREPKITLWLQVENEMGEVGWTNRRDAFIGTSPHDPSVE